MRRSSGAGISCATGLLPSANFSPGEPGSKPRAARGRQRRTVQRHDALLMGAALAQAQSWLAKRRDDLPVIDRDFIDQSSRRERRARSRARRVQALVYVLLVGSIVGLIGWINQSYLREQLTWYTTVRPYMLAASSAVCAHCGGRAGVEAGRFFPGMRQGLPRDGRGACGGIHDGIASR